MLPLPRFLLRSFLALAAVACSSADLPARSGPATSDSTALEALDLDARGMENVKSAAQSGTLAEVKKAYLEYRRNSCPSKYWILPSEKPTQAAEKTDAIGDEILAHRIKDRNYNLYPDPVDMGADFDWTHNPRQKADPAYTDEWTWGAISRMHFWESLAKAYWSTLDEKYAREWVGQLEDFALKNNPSSPAKPSLWRTLDASTRMTTTWPAAYYRFLESPSFNPEAQWIYLRLILDHADLLKKGLEDHSRGGNWVASECFALYTIGVLFPELKEAENLRAFAVDRLVEETTHSVTPDGFLAEFTPSYHYFALSSFIGPMKLARLNGLSVPEIFRAKILAMFQAPVLVMDQSGEVVPTNDSGLCNAAAMACKGLDLLGDDPLLLWAATHGKEGMAPAASTMLPYSGFYAMRGGWKPEDAFLFFRAGPAGLGHEHEDMLEVVLHAWNQTLLFDPGTYSYDRSDWRRFTIGTASHNTIIVDGKWQHRGPTQPPVTQPVSNPWYTAPSFDYVSGCYDKGYQQSVYDALQNRASWSGPKDNSITHTRRVIFLKPYYALLIDTLDGTGRHRYDAHFHMDAPSAKLSPATQAIISQNAPDQAQLALYPLDRKNLDAEIIQGQQDPLLGWFPLQHRAIPTARFGKTQEAPASFATFLYPFKGEEPVFAASDLGPVEPGVWTRALKTGRESAEIVLALDNQPRAMDIPSRLGGTIQAKATGIIIRKPDSLGKVIIGGWGVTTYRDKAIAFTLSQPAAMTWVQQNGHLLVFNADAKNMPLQIKVTKPYTVEATLNSGEWLEISKSGINSVASPLEGMEPLETIQSKSR